MVKRILKVFHTNFHTNRIISKSRKWPAVFEYSELFLQLCTWYKLFDSLDIAKNLLIHSNRLNHERYPEPCFQAIHLYLSSHTLNGWYGNTPICGFKASAWDTAYYCSSPVLVSLIVFFSNLQERMLITDYSVFNNFTELFVPVCHSHIICV